MQVICNECIDRKYLPPKSIPLKFFEDYGVSHNPFEPCILRELIEANTHTMSWYHNASSLHYNLYSQ